MCLTTSTEACAPLPALGQYSGGFMCFVFSSLCGGFMCVFVVFMETFTNHLRREDDWR